jgi:hypothetical protein
MARRINSDEATNFGLFVLAAIKVLEGATKQSLPPEIQDLILTIAAGTCLWFAGKPSARTYKILKGIRLNNGITAGTDDDFVDQSFTAAETTVSAVDVPRATHLPSVSNPEVISEAWRQADIARGKSPIEGTGIYPSEFAARSRMGTSDDDGPQSEAW